MEYYFKSDFSIVETFTDAEGNPINLNDFDFELIYQTTGVNNYRVSKKGNTFIHCSINEADTSKLNVIFQDHRLGCGQLHREISIKVGNPLFKDYQLVVTHPFTEITLVQNGGDQTTGYASAGIPVVIPFTPSVIADIADADSFLGISALGVFFKTTWLNIKAKLKAYFDTIYASITHNHNLNDLAEKSYNSLDDLPTLDFEPADANIQSHIGDEDIHVTSLQKEDFHAHTNKTALDAVKGVNTGDQSSSDFDIKDLSDTTNLRSIWSDKQDALTFSTNIETDKASTTKISAIKTFYDWAVGKFIDLSKIVTSWSATTLNTNIPSEKLVKDSLNLKADISPANGSTSALRALFVRSGAVYNSNTGYYELNNLTDITELEMIQCYNDSQGIRNSNLSGIFGFASSSARTIFALKSRIAVSQNMSYIFQHNATIESFVWSITQPVSSYVGAFQGCTALKYLEYINLGYASTNVSNMLKNCSSLVSCKIYNIVQNISFDSSPLLSLASLQYLVTNRANGTTRITITVHATVWSKLNDAVNYPEWNALLVDAVNNKYIDFATA
jgi:hypothetical protein